MTARSDALAAQLAVLKSKAERRQAIERFESGQPSVEDVRASVAFRSFLAGSGHETRFSPQGEGSASIGGNTVPTKWNSDLVRELKEYSGLLNGFELWNSPHGETTNRPVALPQGAGTAATENAQFTAGPNLVFAQQAWPLAPTYAASLQVSNQVIQDAFNAADPTPSQGMGGATFYGQPLDVQNDHASPTLDDLIRSMLAESLGRVLAPVATTALYAAINTTGVWSSGNSGGFIQLGAATAVTLTSGASTELIQKTVALDTAAQMVEAIDVAYLDGAAFYATPTAWAGLVRQVDSSKRFQLDPSAMSRSLLGYPVVLTTGVNDAVLSTISGIVFGNLSAAMTLRVASGGVSLLRSTEKFAEWLQTYFRAVLRADIAARDARAMIGVKYAAT